MMTKTITAGLALMLFAMMCNISCKKDENGDNNKPFIIMNPPNPLFWAEDLPYDDPGASAYDVTETGDTINIDDRLQVSTDIDVSVVGEYSVFYNVSDEAGNQAEQQIRDVRVVITK